MKTTPPLGKLLDTISLESFWDWLIDHTNCILRAGTTDAILFDDEDLHWMVSELDRETRLVQLIRGKRPMAEFVFAASHVSYVAVQSSEDETVLFECVEESKDQVAVVAHFLMAHGHDGQHSPPTSTEWIN